MEIISRENGRVSGDLFFRKRYRIPSARYPGWDYRWAGAYSVTICTRGRMRCLGDVVDRQVFRSPAGEVVAEEWLKIPGCHPRAQLDEWIVMPDHMHGILIFQGRTPDGPQDSKYLKSQSLGAVIGRFKGDATKRIWGSLKQHDFAWQPRFHDVILRTPADLERVRAYIRDNPKNWSP
jgi:REP element-mobilizing transposase RayT